MSRNRHALFTFVTVRARRIDIAEFMEV